MPTSFVLEQRLIGIADAPAEAGGKVPIRYRDLIGHTDAFYLQQQLDGMHSSLFSRIPGLPDPSTINHLLVLIGQDLACTAYVNELRIRDQTKVNRAVQAGEILYIQDVDDVTGVEIGVDIPPDHGVVFMRSFGWRRSLFFDFGPLIRDVGPRAYRIEQLLARQSLGLLGLPSSLRTLSGNQTRLEHMGTGISRLEHLLRDRSEDEASYQQLLQDHPWMLGGTYSEVLRHPELDDRSIPDFTAIRCYDDCHDIIELKQPFLRLFRKDGDFAAEFNDAWNQAERYLSFVTQQRQYLLEEKRLRFDNPRCVLLLGHALSDDQLVAIRKKEGLGRIVSVLTYDQLYKLACQIYSLARTANQRPLANSGLQQT